MKCGGELEDIKEPKKLKAVSNIGEQGTVKNSEVQTQNKGEFKNI